MLSATKGALRARAEQAERLLRGPETAAEASVEGPRFKAGPLARFKMRDPDAS
jgi:hypothetical protein